MRIGIDIDGVLANFNAAYRMKLISVTGRDLIPEGEEPPCWEYATHYGYTKDEDSRTWKDILADPWFWQFLAPLPGALSFLDWVDTESRYGPVSGLIVPYFITTRPGVDTKGQSERWLRPHVENPAVLIARSSEDKGLLARGLGLTHFLDDKPENCHAVKTAIPSCDVWLLTARYNEWAHEDVRYTDIHVALSLEDFQLQLETTRARAA